jgi:hypothetical protein
MSEKQKVILATWYGGTDFLDVDGNIFERGQQYEVSKKLAHRLKDVPNVEVITTNAGSELDVRPVEPVREPSPDEPGDDLPETPVLRENQTPEPPAESEK